MWHFVDLLPKKYSFFPFHVAELKLKILLNLEPMPMSVSVSESVSASVSASHFIFNFEKLYLFNWMEFSLFYSKLSILLRKQHLVENNTKHAFVC